MSNKRRRAFRNRLIASIFLVTVGLVAVALLAINVTSELRLLNSARSDNVQWTLSQTEVEFLGLQRALMQAQQSDTPDLQALRREFDIFYSRINTLDQSAVFAPVRETEDFPPNLERLRSFLDQTAALMDSDDATLQSSLPTLTSAATEVRPSVRRLSNSGLNFFAQDSDQRRQNISKTLIQLAASATLLFITLVLLAFYLGYLNRLNIKRKREALQASARMNVVTSTALDAVIVADAHGLILEFNAAAEQTFGYLAQDVLGRDLAGLIVPEHQRDEHYAGMARLRAGEQPRMVGKGRITTEARRSDGDVFPVELSIQTAETPDGTIFVAFLRDISRRVAVRKDLVQTRDRALAGEKAKTDFLATMSHEIRTPLNGLLGNLTLLQDTPLNEKQQQYIHNMNTSGRLLMSHISDVLDITKYDAGKLKLRPSDMNISTLIQDIVDNQSGAAAKDTTVSWWWEGPATDWIHADSERLQHILMNIIGNAVKFTPAGEVTVRVSTHQTASDVVMQIKVEDTGIGIAPDLQDEIFGDFMTGDNSYARAVEGTGLGLGIANRFVAAMGGTISVDSTPDVGSLFTIEFPATPIEAPKAVVAEQNSDPVNAPLDVLLVEDNQINRMVAGELLRAGGHSVTDAVNGQIAVDLAQTHRFDLILMDISMPVMDGRTATRLIRAGDGASAAAPIVALTANAVAEEQEAFLTDGMNSVLTKPLSRESLAKLVAGYAVQACGTEPIEENTQLAELRETLGVKATETVMARFVKEADNVVASLSNAQDMSLVEVAETAHRLAGSAAMLGATELRAGLVTIETAAKAQDTSSLAEAQAKLPEVWAQTRVEFAQESK